MDIQTKYIFSSNFGLAFIENIGASTIHPNPNQIQAVTDDRRLKIKRV